MTQLKNISADTKKNIVLWSSTGVLTASLLVARTVYPEMLWLSITLGVGLIVALGGLIHQNRKALRGRSAAYGLNSIITTVLVVAILGVINFLGSKHPGKLDLTKNKIHTISDQTRKLVKDLQKPVQAVYFSKINQREEVRPLLDDLKGLNTKFEVEFVDPDKEPSRAKQAKIKKYGTLQLLVGDREQNIEDPTEEKLTNALIKLLKDKPQTLCTLTGHGEKNFSGSDTEGYSMVKKALEDQSYTVKEFSFTQDGKIPQECDALAIMGANRAFFDAEIKSLRDYLANGGRALIAVDASVKGETLPAELSGLLKEWYVQPGNSLIVDPVSRVMGVDASVAVLANFSKDHSISKEFQGNCLFPFSRPLEKIEGAPAGLNIQWVAQTTPKSWAESDFKQLTSGQVTLNDGADKIGPLNAILAVEGKQKDSKASRNTRLVVFGSSYFVTNNYARFAGNLDFFMNSASWIMEDENLISIRPKEEGPGKVELSQKQGSFIFLLTVILIPGAIAAGGVGIWAFRRRL